MKNWIDVGFDLLRMNSDWLWYVDASGKLMEWRSTSRPLDNEVEKEQLDFTWKELMRDDSTLRDDRASILRAVRDGKAFRYLRTSCNIPHLGVRGWMRISGVPVLDINDTGKIIGYRGAALNITGQMMTNRKLQRMDIQTKNLMLVLDASPMAIFIARPNGNIWTINYANPSTSILLGYSPHEIVNKSVEFMARKSTDPVMIEMLMERIHKRLHTTQRLRLSHKNGSEFWGEITLIPGCAEGGQCTLIGLIRNVDAEIAHQAAEMRRSRLHALGELAGGMAHEINNLLLPACINTEILAEDFPQDSPNAELFQDIAQSLEQIRFIVRNTLQFSRTDNSNDTKDIQGVSIRHTLQGNINNLQSRFGENISIKLEITDNCEGISRISETGLVQILTNLCNNAVHAMKQKGTITIGLDKVHLDGVRVQRETLPLGNYFLISVTDTGCGMNEEVQSHIFEPFFTTKDIGEGTGLGLSVVYGIVTQWGGTITVKSKPNEGTTFTLYVPEDASRKQHQGTNQNLADKPKTAGEIQ